jgi:calcium-dependent protein kinase
MAMLDHPHIIRLHECFEDKKAIHLVLELCRGGKAMSQSGVPHFVSSGELLDRLHAQSGHKYTEKVACGYILTMVSAIRYLHEHNIVHRDLKLENFLFESQAPDSQMKLIDFGLSQHFEEDQVIVAPVGTPYYVAPEVLSGAYNNKCDVWSIGVIAFMLLSGTPPFYGKDDLGTLRSVKAGIVTFEDKYFPNVSNIAKHFITVCLTKNPTQRPDCKHLLEHQWFQLLKSEEIAPSLNIVTRLVLFQKRSALTRLCMEVVAHTLTTDQIQNLRNQFKALDRENTGEILYSDLKNVLQRQSQISTANMEIMFNSEQLQDGTRIKYHEFLAATLSRQNITENNMKVAFDKLSNHHQFITVDHIKDLLGKEGDDAEVENMFKEAKLDTNARIDIDTVSLPPSQLPSLSKNPFLPQTPFPTLWLIVSLLTS